jgi:hypothetical protein
MAGASKNQRRGQKPSTSAYTEQGDGTRIVPLGAGFCYLRDPRNGLTYHVKTNSDKFRLLIVEIANDPMQTAKIEKELIKLSTNSNRFGLEWVNALDWYRVRNEIIVEDSIIDQERTTS